MTGLFGKGGEAKSGTIDQAQPRSRLKLAGPRRIWLVEFAMEENCSNYV